MGLVAEQREEPRVPKNGREPTRQVILGSPPREPVWAEEWESLQDLEVGASQTHPVHSQNLVVVVAAVVEWAVVEPAASVRGQRVAVAVGAATAVAGSPAAVVEHLPQHLENEP